MDVKNDFKSYNFLVAMLSRPLGLHVGDVTRSQVSGVWVVP